MNALKILLLVLFCVHGAAFAADPEPRMLLIWSSNPADPDVVKITRDGNYVTIRRCDAHDVGECFEIANNKSIQISALQWKVPEISEKVRLLTWENAGWVGGGAAVGFLAGFFAYGIFGGESLEMAAVAKVGGGVAAFAAIVTAAVLGAKYIIDQVIIDKENVEETVEENTREDFEISKSAIQQSLDALLSMIGEPASSTGKTDLTLSKVAMKEVFVALRIMTKEAAETVVH